MALKQERYTFDIYNPDSMAINSFSKKINHLGKMDQFLVNICDNVDLMAKAAIDEFITAFERMYFSPIQCCLLGATVNPGTGHVTLEELATLNQMFGYLAFGKYRSRNVDTGSVLQYLNSKEGFPFKRIYRVNDHSIIHPSELAFYQRKYERHPEESRRLFYLCRCLHFNQLKKTTSKGESISLVSSYFESFLSMLMKIEDVEYELDKKEMGTFGAIEFEIHDIEDLDRISKLIKQVLSSEELGLQVNKLSNHFNS
jgi:hypothetical protein